MTADRANATAILWLVVERATNPAERNDIEAWLEDRAETEGGFLWLVNQLGSRPAVIEATIRGMLDASPRQRCFMKQRLRHCEKAQ